MRKIKTIRKSIAFFIVFTMITAIFQMPLKADTTYIWEVSDIEDGYTATISGNNETVSSITADSTGTLITGIMYYGEDTSVTGNPHVTKVYTAATSSGTGSIDLSIVPVSGSTINDSVAITDGTGSESYSVSNVTYIIEVEKEASYGNTITNKNAYLYCPDVEPIDGTPSGYSVSSDQNYDMIITTPVSVFPQSVSLQIVPCGNNYSSLTGYSVNYGSNNDNVVLDHFVGTFYTATFATSTSVLEFEINYDRPNNTIDPETFKVKIQEQGNVDTGDGVAAYLPAPGQFTNEGMGTGGWGDAYDASGELKPFKVSTPSTGISLGYFGGYAVFDFSDAPITNANTHADGIDFTVIGNAFTNNSEPGCIQVSPNGSDWFDIAGSWHYETDTDWGYTVTYEKPDNDGNRVAVNYTYTGELGSGSGTVTTNTFHNHPWYPQYANYNATRTINNQSCPAIHGAKANDSATVGYPFAVYNTSSNTLKLSGVKLGGITGNSSATNAFGYCDVTQGGDGIDLAWAVYPAGHTLEGQPVADSDLANGIKYVRIYTGTALTLGMLGEMSTEVKGIQTASSGSTVSDSSVPDLELWGESIFESISNTPIRSGAGGAVYNASTTNLIGQTVSVTIPANTTVYVNKKKLTANDNTYTVPTGTKYIRVYAKESGKAGKSVWYKLFSN